MSLRADIDKSKLPKHVAVIMDGNGRWAKKHGKLRTFGHRSGVRSVREITETAAEMGIQYLTLYAFSTENWRRPKYEIDTLMELLVNTINKEVKTLMKNDIRLHAIGNIDSLPPKCIRRLREAMEVTKHNGRMTLILALSYSSRWEIVNAVKTLCEKIEKNKMQVSDIDEETFCMHLSTEGIPDPELLIRTSGEYRISNFLLWQLAYSELYFTDKFWPEFTKEDFYTAIYNYQKRERRFGKTSEQVNAPVRQ